jgi:hypothetical protein
MASGGDAALHDATHEACPLRVLVEAGIWTNLNSHQKQHYLKKAQKQQVCIRVLSKFMSKIVIVKSCDCLHACVMTHDILITMQDRSDDFRKNFPCN